MGKGGRGVEGRESETHRWTPSLHPTRYRQVPDDHRCIPAHREAYRCKPLTLETQTLPDVPGMRSNKTTITTPVFLVEREKKLLVSTPVDEGFVWDVRLRVGNSVVGGSVSGCGGVLRRL